MMPAHWSWSIRWTCLLAIVALSLHAPSHECCAADGQAAAPVDAAALDVDGDHAAQIDAAQQADEERRQGTEAMGRFLGRIFSGMFGSRDSDEAEVDEFLHLLGQPAPKFELENVAGEKVRLEDLQGRVVVLDFWATWCGPCMAALPEIEKVHTAFADQPVTVLGVNQSDERDAVLETVAARGTTFVHVLDSDGSVGDSFGASAIPHTVLIDQEGVVQHIHQGFSPTLGRQLTSSIQKLLDGEKLFDAEKAAAARERREQRSARLLEKVGIDRPERLQRLDVLLPGSDVSMTNYYNAAQWVELPGEAKPALVIATGDQRLAIVRPDDGAAHVDLQLPPQIGVWNFRPVLVGGAMHWAVMGAEYNHRYRIKQFTVSLFNSAGLPVWSQVYPMLTDESYPDADFAVGDVTGDGNPELLLLVEHDDLEEAGAAGPDGATLVLTIYSVDGEQLLRAWVPGDNGAAMHVLPEAGGGKLLFATHEGLTRFQVRVDRAEPEDDSL